jgi:choline transporter-like protein 2/4/5
VGVDSHLKSPRRCTDILFLIIWWAFWITMFALGGYGVTNGNPKALVMGTDYEGEMCNSGNNTGFPVRYFVNVAEVLYSINGLAASIAPTAVTGVDYNLADAKSICLAACPTVSNSTTSAAWVCNYPDSVEGYSSYTRAQWAAANYDYFNSLPATGANSKASSLSWKGPCYPVLFETVNTFDTCQYYGEGDNNTYTYLTSQSSYNDIFSGTTLAASVSSISSAVEGLLGGNSPLVQIERYIDDFITGWKVLVLAGVVTPIILSIVYLFILRYFTGVFAYLILFTVNALAIVVTIFLFLKAGIIGSDAISAFTSSSSTITNALDNYADPADSNKAALEVCAYVMCALTVIFFLFSLLMLRRIRVAVGVIKVAVGAFGKIPSLIVFPLLPAVCMVLLGVYWLSTMIYLFSSGEMKLQSCTMDSGSPPMLFCQTPGDAATCHCGYAVSWDRNLQGALAFYFFGFLWGSQWIIAMSYLVVACVFTQYYFLGGNYNAVKNSPILVAIKKMTWYHSGTAAVGSFFVAILQFVRIVLAFLMSRMKKLGKDSKIIMYIGYYVQYCLWYLQKVIEWLNRRAYIMTAIEGTSFCTSAWNALSLMVKNVVSVAAVGIIGDIMLVLGKLSIALGSGTIAFLIMENETFVYGDEKVSSPLFIVIIVGIFAFCIASVFMSIVELGIDTILLCYCKDSSDHDGTPVNAPPALTNALGIASKVKQMKVEEAKQRAERAAAAKSK